MWSTKFWRHDARRDNVVGTTRINNAKNGSRRPRRLMTEFLEQRQLLAVSPVLLDAAASGASDVARQYGDASPGAVAPVAAADAFAINGHQQLGANVLANDVHAEGTPLSVAIQDGPSHGTLKLDADGLFIYVPDRGFDGVDTFTYQFNDGQADSNVATVTIEVKPLNSPPAATDDAFTVDENQVLSIDGPGVLANDTDANGDSLDALLATAPRNGTLALGANGSFQYTPNTGFSGTDSFSYKANDGQADSLLANVTITVNPVNQAPTAADDTYVTDQGLALTVPAVGVLGNDADADGDSLTAVLVEGPANGTLQLGADGSFQYTPNDGFNGTDSFSYKANDGQADSLLANVTITVNPVENPAVKELKVHLETSDSAFGSESGSIWGGSTFWVCAYVQDLRDVPQGVVGGAIDLGFDTASVTPTGNVVYGTQFTEFQQGAADTAAGLIDEAGALTTNAGVGADGLAPFVAWEFRRSGASTSDDANSAVSFVADPGEGTATILPGNFALVGSGTAVDWSNVEFDTAGLNLYLGDFNGDGGVNHCDLALWIPHAGSAAGDGVFEAKFDLNADARIDASDLSLLMPRLYRSVLDAPDSGDSGDGLQSSAIHNRLMAPPRRAAAFAQLAESHWSVDADTDSQWDDAILSHQSHKGHSRHFSMAVDSVMEAYDSPSSVG